jgi:dTDP-glucose 4,6-dehydratase
VADVARGVESIVNFAAESHVDRSIESPATFLRTNVRGTLVLLDAALEMGLKRFIQISTDEVYGALGPEGKFTESTPLSPNSPYSASKASADLLVGSFHKTYGLDTVIARGSNNYGPYQFPEKLIPLMITNALEDKELPVYGDGLHVRDWIHVEDYCRAILTVLERGRPGEVYNVGGGNELENINLVKKLLNILSKPEQLITFVKDRPGHDRRYAIDCTKLVRELGWEPRIDFEEGLRRTVSWYVDNKEWWRKIKTGEYLEYYEKQYGAG